jgi:putative ABC transport system permease protein
VIRLSLASLRSSRVVVGLITVVSGLLLSVAAAVASFADAVLLRPLAFPDAGELVILGRTRPSAPEMFGASLPDFLDWREWGRPWLADVGAYETETMVAWLQDQVVNANVAFTTASLWSVLRIQPLAGRVFSEDDARSTRAIALVGEQFWRARLAADPAVIGRRIALAGPGRTGRAEYEIVGVVPSSMRLEFSSDVAVYALLATEGIAQGGAENSLRRLAGYRVIGRLRPGISVANAASGLDRLHPTDYGHFTKNDRLSVRELAEHVLGRTRNAVRALVVATILMLAVACANLAAFIMSRIVRRGPVYSLLMMLGAPRWKVVAGVITETVLMVTPGALLAMILGPIVLRLIVWSAPQAIPRINEASLDISTLTVTIMSCMAMVALICVIPASHATNPSLALRMHTWRAHAAITRRVFLAIQFAVVVWLLLASGLLTSAVWRFYSAQLGFDATAVTFTRINPRYQESGERHLDYEGYRRTLHAVSGLAGVRGATFAQPMPLETLPRATVSTDHATLAGVPYVQVFSGYFAAMKIPLVVGRDFSGDHRSDPSVVIVSERFASRAFGSRDVLGRTIQGPLGTQTIVAVAGDARFSSLTEPIEPMIYVPFGEKITSIPRLVIRWTAQTADIRASLIRVLRDALPPGVVVDDPVWLDDWIDRQRAGIRFVAFLVLGFAVLGSALALAGLHVATQSLIAARRREMAIRIVVGASPRDLAALLMSESVFVLSTGVLVGLVAHTATAAYGAAVVQNGTGDTGVVTAITCVGIALVGLTTSLHPVFGAVRARPGEWLRST